MNTITPEKPRKAKISSVRIEHVQDESPDYSYLGKLRSTAKGWHLDRKTGELLDSDGTILAADVPTDYSRGEYEFITDFQQSGDPSSWNHVSDKGVINAWLRCRYTGNGGEIPIAKNLFAWFKVTGWQTAQSRADKVRCLDIVYCCLGCYRLYRMFRDDWHYMGVIAKAEYVSASGISQTLRSGGLWGIESDSGENYLKETADEQLAELRSELQQAGFSDRQITRAFKNVETVRK